MMTKENFAERVRKGDVNLVEETEKVLEECGRLNKEYSYFNTISDGLALEQAEELQEKIVGNDKSLKNKKLLGYFISVKDNICVKGIESTAGSRILKGYKPLFDATAVQKVKEQGGIIIGKTSQDEFGFGSFSVNVGVDLEVPKNPFDKERSCGGSSGGAGGITQKAPFPHIAVGESTGGSIASPASFCSVFGLSPTYGRVSRYGLIDFSNSLDKIGPLGRTIAETSKLLEAMSGFDEKDSTSLKEESSSYKKESGKSVKGMKIGVVKEAFEEGVDEKVSKKVWQGIKKLESEGVEVKDISLKLPIKYGLPTYYLLGTSEASTNLAKYCGMRYGKEEEMKGNFNEYFTKVRSNHLGNEAKRRIMLGTFARMSGYRDAYYIKAAKVRGRMVEEYKKAFKGFDSLITPTAPILPPKISDIQKLTPLQHYMMDVMLMGPNVAGLPHLNVPAGFENKLPAGMLLIGNHLEESKLLRLGRVFEK